MQELLIISTLLTFKSAYSFPPDSAFSYFSFFSSFIHFCFVDARASYYHFVVYVISQVDVIRSGQLPGFTIVAG